MDARCSRSPQPGQTGRQRPMPGGAQQRRRFPPAPPAVPGPVYQHKSSHTKATPRRPPPVPCPTPAGASAAHHSTPAYPSFRRQPESLPQPGRSPHPRSSFRCQPESLPQPGRSPHPRSSFRRQPESLPASSVPRRSRPNFAKSSKIVTAAGLTPPAQCGNLSAVRNPPPSQRRPARPAARPPQSASKSQPARSD